MPGADPADYAVRLGLWLAARQQNPYRDNTTFVACAPLDRSTSAYTIAESDVRAVLDENARMREELEALHEALIGLQTSSFKVGWWKCRESVTTAAGLLRGEADTLAYAMQLRQMNAEAAPQQPARDMAGTRGCDHGPGWQCAGCVGEGEFRFEPLNREQRPAHDTNAEGENR